MTAIDDDVSRPTTPPPMWYTNNIYNHGAFSATKSDTLYRDIELTSRDTFHRSHSDKTNKPNKPTGSRCDAATLPSSSGDAGTVNEKLLEMMTTSFRLPCTIPIHHIIETISMVHID